MFILAFFFMHIERYYFVRDRDVFFLPVWCEVDFQLLLAKI